MGEIPLEYGLIKDKLILIKDFLPSQQQAMTMQSNRAFRYPWGDMNTVRKQQAYEIYPPEVLFRLQEMNVILRKRVAIKRRFQLLNIGKNQYIECIFISFEYEKRDTTSSIDDHTPTLLILRQYVFRIYSNKGSVSFILAVN